MAFKNVVQPKTFSERCTLAERTVKDLQLTSTVLVDTMDDLSRKLFGDLPSPAIIIGADGVVKTKLPWAEPAVLTPRLTGVLKSANAAAKVKAPQVSVAKGLRLVWTGQTDDGARILREILPTLDTNVALRAQALCGLAAAHAKKGENEKSRSMIKEAADSARQAWKGRPKAFTAFLAGLLDHSPGAKLGAALLDEMIKADETVAAWAEKQREKLSN